MKNVTPVLLAGAALLLASCNRTSAPQPEAASGKVVELKFDGTTGAPSYTAWSGGAGQVVASVGTKELVRTDLKADGSFSLSLPKPDAALLSGTTSGSFTANLPNNCTGNLSLSGATDAKSAVPTFSVQAQKSGQIAPLASGGTASSPTAETGLYIYLDKAVGLSGQITCIQNNIIVTGNVNAQFSAGWNKVSTSVAITSAGGTVTLKAGNIPSTWVYGAPTALSLRK